jgi:hypothetical protein
VISGARSLALAACVLAGSVASCTEATDTLVEPELVLEILEVRFMDIILPGSGVRVRTRGLSDVAVDDPRLVVSHIGGQGFMELASPVSDGEELVYYLPIAPVVALMPGAAVYQLQLHHGALVSAPVAVTWHVAHALEASLHEMPSGSFHRDESVLIGGDGLLDAGEGANLLEVTGSFVRDADDAVVVVDTQLFVDLVDPLDRTRGHIRLSTAIGGLSPGRFTGSVRVLTNAATGTVSASAPFGVDWIFLTPVIYEVAGSSAALGQYVSILGGGFLGGQGSSELTILSLEGTVTVEGGAPSSFGPTSVYAEWVSDSEVKLPLEPAVQNSELVSALFGARRFTFDGAVTPIVSAGGVEEVVGNAISTQIHVTGARQVVVVRFLSTFEDSLHRFGLGIVAEAVREATLARINAIWGGYAVSVHQSAPADAIPSAVATLEIGGPDPNGIGLFGYDNTPGKDVGNIRLSDSIGGSNAEVQEDGAPGYGGVFIESYLWWSSHPGLALDRPAGAPPADPLFDQLFDAVRSSPATLNEFQGLGDPTRVILVQRAVHALGSVIGETAAHELGHSFGLAQPYGSKTAYHSKVPGPGCLMDGGAERPLAERASQPGANPIVFCADEPSYLEGVLPLD